MTEMERIERIWAAQAQVRNASQVLRLEVISAVTQGIPLARIASSTGISRTTIYRWLCDEGLSD